MSTERIRLMSYVWAGLALLGVSAAVAAQGQDEAKKPPAPPAAEAEAKPKADAPPELTPPPEIPEVKLGPTLPTVAVRKGERKPNTEVIDASLLPRDKEGIWVLDFAFWPLRMVTTDVPGKGRRQVHYLYYRVINHTGKARMLVPQFTLVTDTGKRYEDTVLPQAVRTIQSRQDPSIPVRGAVDIMGMIPPSEKEGIDDAVFGVAVWEGVDPHADRMQIYVRGLSDGYQTIKAPDTEKPVVRYKTLRIDVIRRGDALHLNENEIRFLDPPYEWVYW